MNPKKGRLFNENDIYNPKTTAYQIREIKKKIDKTSKELDSVMKQIDDAGKVLSDRIDELAKKMENEK